MSLTTRLWAGEVHAEVEWTVGPIPVEADNVGRSWQITLATSRDEIHIQDRGSMAWWMTWQALSVRP